MLYDAASSSEYVARQRIETDEKYHNSIRISRMPVIWYTGWTQRVGLIPVEEEQVENASDVLCLRCGDKDHDFRLEGRSPTGLPLSLIHI